MKEKWKEWFEKKEGRKDWFGTAFPILLGMGVIFLILSNTHISKQEANAQTEVNTNSAQEMQFVTYEDHLTQQLEEAFSHIAGVGKVQVLLTLEDDGEVTVLQDLDYTRTEQEESDSSGAGRKTLEEQRQTETVRDAQDQPYILRENMPKVRGILILAEGAESSVVQQELLHSVQALLGVSADEVHIVAYQ